MSKKGPAKIQPACADAPVDGKLSLQDGSTIERGRLKASPTKAARSPSPNAHKYAIDGEDGKARDVTAVSDAHMMSKIMLRGLVNPRDSIESELGLWFAFLALFDARQ